MLGGDFRLYLYGSYARGDWAEGLSDVDLVVVSHKFKNTPFTERAASIRRLARSDIPFEILCYTPEELNQLLETSTFIKEISKYWKQLH